MSHDRLIWMIGTTALSCACSTRAAERVAVSPDAGYRAERLDPITHQVDFSVVVTPPYRCDVLKVWLPLPPSDEAQEVTNSRLSTFPMHVEPRIGNEPVYGNRFAYFEFRSPQGAQIVRHQFTARVCELRWNVDPEQVQRDVEWPASFVPYLKPQAITDRERFQAVLDEIAPPRKGSARGLLNAIDWVERNLTYDHAAASLRADADHAFNRLRGHCSDYHGLCATMGRALGYPTRVTYGLSLFPKNSPSHCKLEAYLPPYGWVSFDVSETQKLIAKIGRDHELSEPERERLSTTARNRLRRGFRENSWLLVTKGTDYDLEPKAARRAPVIRTIYAEADGAALPDPDPANANERTFAWMTVHEYKADREFQRPFEDVRTLEGW